MPRNYCPMHVASSSSRCQERPKRVRGERQRQQDVEFRQRKKQERQQLLETAQQLETQLTKLQQATSWPGSPLHNKRKGFSWQSKAETIKQQRVEAELLNMTLRRALAKEQQVAKSLQMKMNKRPFMPLEHFGIVYKAEELETNASCWLCKCSRQPCTICGKQIFLRSRTRHRPPGSAATRPRYISIPWPLAVRLKRHCSG